MKVRPSIIRKYLSRIILKLATVYWFLVRPKEFGVKAVIRHKDEILLIKHGYGYESYSLPGGRIEKTETPDEAVAREVEEEVGIKRDNKFVYLGSLVSRDFYKYDTVLIYSLDLQSRPSVAVDNVEVIDAKWFKVDQLPRMGALAQKILKIYAENQSKQN